MRTITAAPLLILLSSWVTGCETTTPGVLDAGVAPCEGASCDDEPPPESVCVEHVSADILDDGCGVFVAGNFGGGDDRNPGTKAKPVYTIERAVELARTGRGRVFICNDGFELNHITLPTGVDLLGGFDCRRWDRDPRIPESRLFHRGNYDPPVTIEPAGPEDTGAADGVSTLADLQLRARGAISVLVQSNTAAEILRSKLDVNGGMAGSDGEDWPSNQPDGPDGVFAAEPCSAAIVAGGAAAVNRCESGLNSVGGKGGDGLPDSAEDGGDGESASARDPSPSGVGGTAEQDNVRCYSGSDGGPGGPGTQGASGEGIGRLTETGWVGGTGAEGSWGDGGKGGRGAPGAALIDVLSGLHGWQGRPRRARRPRRPGARRRLDRHRLPRRGPAHARGRHLRDRAAGYGRHELESRWHHDGGAERRRPRDASLFPNSRSYVTRGRPGPPRPPRASLWSRVHEPARQEASQGVVSRGRRRFFGGASGVDATGGAARPAS
ncbi:hypothetical protein WME94_40445 [Sorangium sp. So ce429]